MPPPSAGPKSPEKRKNTLLTLRGTNLTPYLLHRLARLPSLRIRKKKTRFTSDSCSCRWTSKWIPKSSCSTSTTSRWSQSMPLRSQTRASSDKKQTFQLFSASVNLKRPRKSRKIPTSTRKQTSDPASALRPSQCQSKKLILPTTTWPSNLSTPRPP